MWLTPKKKDHYLQLEIKALNYDKIKTRLELTVKSFDTVSESAKMWSDMADKGMEEIERIRTEMQKAINEVEILRGHQLDITVVENIIWPKLEEKTDE